MTREAAGYSGPFAPLDWLRSHIVAVYAVSGTILTIALFIAAYSFLTNYVREEIFANVYEFSGGHVKVQPASGPFTQFDETAARLKAVPGVKQVRAVVEGKAMIVTQFGSAATIVRGLRADDLKALHAFSDNVRFGTLDGFEASGGIAIGKRLANSLNVSVGSEISLLAPAVASTPSGKMPRVRRFTVKAIFEAGVAEYDGTFVFLPLEEAQDFFNLPGAVHALEVLLDNPRNAEAMRPSLQAAAGDGMLLDNWLPHARAAAQNFARYAAIFDKLNGHVIVRPLARPFNDFDETAARLKAVPGVKQALPVVEGQAMASSQKASSGLNVRGLRADDLKALTAVSDNVRSGTLDGFDEFSGIAIGTRLANTLNVSVGSEVTLTAPRGATTPFGTAPSVKRFTVNAIFEMGMPDYDSTFVFIPLKEAQSFFSVKDAVHVLVLFADNPENIDAMRPSLQAAAGDDMLLSDWRQRKAALAALQKTWSKE